MIQNPPKHPFSDMCCQKAKKDTAHGIENDIRPQLACIGIRKAEGGQRASISSCFKEVPFGCSVLRPIFWIRKGDRKAYERAMQIRHSACYTLYGLDRTGCAWCPFGKHFERELEAAKKYGFNLKPVLLAINDFFFSYRSQIFCVCFDCQTIALWMALPVDFSQTIVVSL